MKKVVLFSIIGVIVLAPLTIFFLIKDIYFLDESKTDKIEVYSNIDQINKNIKIKAKYCSILLRSNCVDISNFVVQSKEVKTDKLGTITLQYSIKYKNKQKKYNKKIKIVDTTPPIITLNEINEVCPNNFIEPGFSVSDNYSKDLQKNVKTEQKDDVIYYTVTDESGNKTVAKRKLLFLDSIAPTITLNGNSTDYVILNNNYNDPGVIASDNCTTNIQEKVQITNNVDTSKVGTYTITYKVKDDSGNETIATRTVKVYNPNNNVVLPTNKVVYLTFDDGPGPYTETLLQILDKYNVKATFFVTNQFPDYQYLIKQEFEKSHTIAIHSYSHVYKNIYSGVDEYFNDVNQMNEIIHNQTGNYSTLLRFPGGSSNTISKFNPGIMSTLSYETATRGFTYFDWNVESNDTGTTDSDIIYNNIINGINSHNYSIVLQHDIKKASVEATEKVILYGIENGYNFMPLDSSSPTVHHKINN